MEILTNQFKILLADQFYFSLCQCSNTTYYMVGGKPEEFSGNTIPLPAESIDESFYDFYDQLLFGKIIEPSDVSYMIRNIPWTANEKYEFYDDKNGDLATTDFYVIADQDDGSYGVFKCIYKDVLRDPVSINKPNINQTSATDEIYITGDGYQWKYMFTIPSVTYNKFATTNYVPVVPNANVESAAVAGTIDAVKLNSSGSQYNNYAYGKIKEAAVGGDVTKFSLLSEDFFTVNTYDIVYTGNGTFSEGDSIDITVPGANTVSAEVYSVGLSTISVEITSNTENITQSTVVSANGFITVASANTAANIVQIRAQDIPLISGSTNFYKDSIIYIRQGTGAGQVRTITDYAVSGSERIITVDSPFSVLPTSASTFSILPNINIIGDGTGAIALPVMDSTANSIVDVQILNRGAGYTYATATVSGNTGILDSNGSIIIANNASVTPIIAPQGGHGSDPVSELYGTNIGVSSTFANSEVLNYVSYSKIGLIRNILHDNVQITLSSLDPGDFSNGEIVVQESDTTSSGLSKARGVIEEIDTTNNILHLTNVFGVFEVSSNNQLIGLTSNTYSTITNINKDVTKFNNNKTLGITPVSGNIQVGETITQANTNASGYVLSANSTIVSIGVVKGNFDTNVSNRITGGTSGAIAVVASVSANTIVDNSGDVIYIENTQQIDRSDETSEQIKLIVKF